MQKGYTVLHVDDVYSRAYVTPEKWTQPPPAFREVTADNLKFDLEDALKMQKRIMGCHNPQELVAQYRRVLLRCCLTEIRRSTSWCWRRTCPSLTRRMLCCMSHASQSRHDPDSVRMPDGQRCTTSAGLQWVSPCGVVDCMHGPSLPLESLAF